MANAFEDLVSASGATPTTRPTPDQPNAFGDLVPVTAEPQEPPPQRSYFGASLRSSGQGLISSAAGAVGSAMETFGGIPTKKDLAYLYRNDPEGFDSVWKSPAYAAQRLEEDFANRATETMSNLTPGGQQAADRSYVPWNDKKQFVGIPSTTNLERLAGDYVQSGTQSVGMMATIAAAARGGPRPGMIAGGVEGALEGQQTRQQVRQELEAAPLAAWQSVPAYQKLIKEGWHPEMARRAVIDDAAGTAGLNNAVLSGIIAGGGGALLGHAPSGGILRRIAGGAAVEIPVEMGQGAVGQIEQNLAARSTIDPKRNVFEDVDEQMAQGAIIGGLQGGTFNAALGRRRAAAQEKAIVEQSLGAPADIVATRPLPGIAEDIKTAAAAAGVDPAIATGVASIESGFNPSAVNGIGATGLFQFLPGAMQTYGVTKEALLADPALQISAGVRMLADAGRAVEKATGRPALPGEIYMAQLFGHGGVQEILKAPDDKSLLEVVKGYGGTQDVLTANNIPLDMTVGQAKERYAGLMAAHMSGRGGQAVDPGLGKYRSEARSLLDSMDDEMLADSRLRVLQADIDAAAARPGLRERDNADTLNRVQEGAAPVVANPVEQTRQLTQEATDLLAAKGDLMLLDNRPISENDRLWRIAESNGLKFNMHAPVSSVITQLKELQTQPADPARLVEQQLGASDIASPLSLLDTGMSDDERRTRQEESNPNHRLRREERPVQFGPAEAIGKPIREAALRPGEVATAALPYAGATHAYMGAIHDTVQQLITQFAPRARVLLTHESRGDAVATQRDLGNGWYHINPRNLTRFDKIGSKYNPTTQAKIAYSTAHEVGHVIVDQEFMAPLSESQQAAIESLPKMGYFEEEFLAGLPKDQQAILREYNEVKRSLLEDPSKGARDFILRWLSPWKTSHGWAQAKNPSEGWKRFADTPGRGTSSRMSARQFGEALSISHPGILGVHEYLAEQFARYTQQKSLVEKTALGRSEWFQEVLGKLQAFFRAAKLAKLVAPSETFSRWLTQLADRPETSKGRRQAVPVESFAADRSGATRFDDPESVALRDKLLFDETLGRQPVLPAGLEFQVDEKTPGQLTFNIADAASGQVHYFLDAQVGGAQPGKILNTKNVTQKFSGLGPALYEFAANEMDSRGQPLRSGDTTSTFAERIWQKRMEAGAATKDGRVYSAIPDRVRQEALELLSHGQPETAKEVVEMSVGKPKIIRWDGDVPGFAEADGVMQQLDRVKTARSATREFLSTGTRRLIELGQSMLDVRQMAAGRPHVLGLTMINNALTSMEAFRGTLETQAMEVGQKWANLQQLGKEGQRLSRFMEAEYTIGKHIAPLQLNNGRLEHVANADFVKAAKASGLSQISAQLFLDIKNQYLARLNLLQKFMRSQIVAAREDNPDRSAFWNAKLQALGQMFDSIRATPFHPQTRYGNHVLEVRRAGESQPFHVQAFESAAQRATAREKIEQLGRSKGERWTASETYHDSQTAIMRVLPPAVMDAIGLGGTLTPKQRRQLMSSLDTVTRNGVLRKYSPELGAVTGASREHLRVYADFMHNDSILLSKMLFRSDFQDGLNAIKDVIVTASKQGDSATVADLESVLKFSTKAVRQILNPAQEWHAIRSFVVLHDLWGNIKSAVANLTDLVKNWSVITKRLGVIGGTSQLGGSAAKITAEGMTQLMKRVVPTFTQNWGSWLSAEESRVLAQAAKEGLIKETAAAQLSGWANASTLERLGFSRGARIVDTVMRFGMQPFQIVDQFTRRLTLLSMYDAYRKQGLAEPLAYNAAKQDVYLLNRDNSILNRAEMMRGKKGTLLIYYDYMRSMGWLMSGGYTRARTAQESMGALPPTKGIGNETMRMWFAYLALGGIMGLPGAEDLDALVELIAKQLGYRFSPRELAYQLASEVIDAAPDLGLGMSPRNVVHGLTTQLPLPGGGAVDISSSVSLGHAVPGLGGLPKLGTRDESGFLFGLLGPAGRRIQEAMNLFDDNLPPERRYALGIPTSVQNVVKGLSEPRFYSGGHILVDPQTGEIKDRTTMEVVAQMMGFQPSEIAARQELHYMQKDYADYWVGRRNGVLAQVWEARLSKDQDAIHRAMESVKEFNQASPTSGMRITGESLARSMTSRQGSARRDERGEAKIEGLRPGFRNLRDSVLGPR